MMLNQMVNHHDKYVNFHVFKKLKEGMSPADLLVGEAMDFFNNRDFTVDVVDLLIKVACDALFLDLFIYQRHEGYVQRVKTSGGQACREIHVKFTHNNISSLGNHYDAIVQKTPDIVVMEDLGPEEEEDDLITQPPNVNNSGDSGVSQPEIIEILSDYEVEGDMNLEFPEDASGQNIPRIGRGKYFPVYLFEGMDAEKVDALPGDVDGKKMYIMSTSGKDWRTLTNDLHHFVMRTSSKANYHGTIKTGTCIGSWICPNKNCAFRKLSHGNQPNRINFVRPKGPRKYKICNQCDTVAVQEGCGARKMVDYDPNREQATVFHLGKHKCWQKLDTKRKMQETVKNRSVQKGGTAKSMAMNEIMHALSTGIKTGDMSNIRSTAANWTDLKTARQVLKEQDQFQGEDHNSFDAVAIAKRATDELDPYYIYRINNKYMNNGVDYVFKSSRVMAEIAISMDIEGPKSLFQLENAYFDCTHTHVYGFKSMGIWTVHPTLGEMLRLASMELRSENTEAIAKCLKNFNKILQDITGNPEYKFNPRTFMCDEGSANYQAVQLVYGAEFTRERVKGCQWHYKYNLLHRVNQVGPDMRDLFHGLCKKICEVTTVTEYELIKGRLDQIAKAYPEVAKWIDWWHTRRYHIFTPFRFAGLPGCNLAEAGNAGWKMPTMRLVDAAKYDVSTMIWMEEQIYKFNRNLGSSIGRAPNRAARDAKDRDGQMCVAEGFAKIVKDRKAMLREAESIMNPPFYLPPGKNTHKPPKRKVVLSDVVDDVGLDDEEDAEYVPPEPKKSKATKKKDNGPAKKKDPPAAAPQKQPTRKKAPARKTTAKAKQAQKIAMDEDVHREKIQIAVEVMGLEEVPDVRGGHHKNPPVIICCTGTAIRRCYGCDKDITAEQKRYPRDLVFRRRGEAEWYDKKRNEKRSAMSNLHYHLNPKCLRSKDPSLNWKVIMMTDDAFDDLTRDQMQVLHDEGFLKHVVANLEK